MEHLSFITHGSNCFLSFHSLTLNFHPTFIFMLHSTGSTAIPTLVQGAGLEQTGLLLPTGGEGQGSRTRTALSAWRLQPTWGTRAAEAQTWIQAATLDRYHVTHTIYPRKSGGTPDFGTQLVMPSLLHLRSKSLSGYLSSYENIQTKQYINQKKSEASINLSCISTLIVIQCSVPSQQHINQA